MSKQGTLASTPPPHKPPEAATYVAPRVTGKRSLEMVTLASPTDHTGGRTTPGGPGWIGHP
jgi:hypothetical protein